MSRLAPIGRLRQGARLGLVLGLAAFAGATPAGAQSMDYGSFETLFKGPVTTSATGSPQRDTDVPVNMTIVTAGDIRRSGARDIAGVLRHVSGVDLMQSGADNTDVSVRGYDQAYASGTLVLVDGRQVYADYYGFIPWSALPVELGAIRQIEVVKGPNAALFGFNAAHGVINIITYNPRYDDVDTVSLRTGSPALGEVSGVATVKLGAGGGLRLSGGYRKNQDFSTEIPPAMATSTRRENNRANIDADLVYALGDGFEMALEASHTHAAVNEVSPNSALQNSRYETNSVQGRLTADTDVGLLQLAAYTNWIGWKGAPIVLLGPWEVKNRVTVVEADGLFNIGADHTLRLSAAYRHNEANTAPFPGGEVSYDVFSGSGNWQWQIASSLALTTAVRLDHLALDRSGTAPPDYPFVNADWARTLDEVSYNVGLVWSVSSKDTVRFMASRGVQLPSLVELGAVVIAAPSFDATGNPALKPTVITNYEVAWDRDVPHLDMKLRIAAFHQDTKRLSSVSGNFTAGPSTVYSTPANVGDSRADGVEITADGRIAESWHWTIGYRLEAVVDHLLPFAADGSDFVDFEHTTPKHLLKLGAGWSDDRWEADGFVHWQSNVTGLQFVNLGTMRVPVGSFASADARIGFRLTDWATIAVSGQNLLQDRQKQTAGPEVGRQIFLAFTLINR